NSRKESPRCEHADAAVPRSAGGALQQPDDELAVRAWRAVLPRCHGRSRPGHPGGKSMMGRMAKAAPRPGQSARAARVQARGVLLRVRQLPRTVREALETTERQVHARSYGRGVAAPGAFRPPSTG